MRKIYFLLILALSSLYSFSQQTYKVNYQQLKEFEGLYEYYNHATLEIAASPKDTVLYAILGKSRYRLAPSGKDSFLNLQKVKVEFFRNKSNAIAGYINGKDTFKLV